MATNKELVQQAVAAIPLWRAFLDQKEAEQDAILAEMRNENAGESRPKKLIKRLTARFRGQPATSTQKETPNWMSELPASPELNLPPALPESYAESNLLPEGAAKRPLSEAKETQAENDLLDKEVEVDLPTASPTSAPSANKKAPVPIVPITTEESIQQVPEEEDDDEDDSDDNKFKDLF